MSTTPTAIAAYHVHSWRDEQGAPTIVAGDTQRFEITIDGIVFPWLIANLDTDAAPAIDLGGILALRVGILADQVVVTNGPLTPPEDGGFSGEGQKNV